MDLQIPARGITALFGPSGCGKTTLLRAIAGLDHHPDGKLQVGPLTWQDSTTLVPPHRRQLGYVFQEASLFPHLNVSANLRYGVKRSGKAGSSDLQQAIELLGIGNLLQRQPHTLSGGERQRVAIARALAAGPRLLLMDEPLASLDMARKQEILPYIETLRESLDIPVIYVSHAQEEVARLADHLVLLEAGREVASGEIHTMLARLDLPLAHDPDAATIIDAEVTAHDDAHHLTYLDCPAGRITVLRQRLEIGARVRVRVAARDVSLTLERQSGTSIQNIFPATVEALTPKREAEVTVRLAMTEIPLLARVTRKSATLLQLQPGKPVFVQAKSVALLS